jgi:hypothetical protein
MIKPVWWHITCQYMTGTITLKGFHRRYGLPVGIRYVYYTGLFKMIGGVWPLRSPDATPCDFFLWGYVKDQVYVPHLPASIPELKVRIRTAIETITADTQFGTNSIIVLMFVESQRVHI